MFNGRGIYKVQDGSKYEGWFENSKLNGFGIKTSAEGAIIQKGQWANDVFIA